MKEYNGCYYYKDKIRAFITIGVLGVGGQSAEVVKRSRDAEQEDLPYTPACSQTTAQELGLAFCEGGHSFCL